MAKSQIEQHASPSKMLRESDFPSSPEMKEKHFLKKKRDVLKRFEKEHLNKTKHLPGNIQAVRGRRCRKKREVKQVLRATISSDTTPYESEGSTNKEEKEKNDEDSLKDECPLGKERDSLLFGSVNGSPSTVDDLDYFSTQDHIYEIMDELFPDIDVLATLNRQLLQVNEPNMNSFTHQRDSEVFEMFSMDEETAEENDFAEPSSPCEVENIYHMLYHSIPNLSSFCKHLQKVVGKLGKSSVKEFFTTRNVYSIVESCINAKSKETVPTQVEVIRRIYRYFPEFRHTILKSMISKIMEDKWELESDPSLRTIAFVEGKLLGYFKVFQAVIIEHKLQVDLASTGDSEEVDEEFLDWGMMEIHRFWKFLLQFITRTFSEALKDMKSLQEDEVLQPLHFFHRMRASTKVINTIHMEVEKEKYRMLTTSPVDKVCHYLHQTARLFLQFFPDEQLDLYFQILCEWPNSASHLRLQFLPIMVDLMILTMPTHMLSPSEDLSDGSMALLPPNFIALLVHKWTEAIKSTHRVVAEQAIYLLRLLLEQDYLTRVLLSMYGTGFMREISSAVYNASQTHWHESVRSHSEAVFDLTLDFV